MTYEKQFDSIDELDAFVEFQKRENGLEFHWDRVSKRAWIECNEETNHELVEADTHS